MSGDECPTDMDGEFIGDAPVKVKVMKKAARFLTAKPAITEISRSK
ncbi:MAG: hypothetical protein ABI954_03160 [Pyrinomonadaceae bacterium]